MTDRQPQLMAAAVQRKDCLLTIPPNLTGAAVAKVAAGLIAGRDGRGDQGESWSTRMVP
jgi:hypothetical protein